MMKLKMMLLAMATVTLATACGPSYSNGPDKGGNNQKGSGQGQGGGTQPAGDTPLTKHPWCVEYESNGQYVQERWVLGAKNKGNYTQYATDGRGTRGGKLNDVEFDWSLNGANLTITVQGQNNVFPIRLDPAGGQPVLYIGDGAQQVEYNKCP